MRRLAHLHLCACAVKDGEVHHQPACAADVALFEPCVHDAWAWVAKVLAERILEQRTTCGSCEYVKKRDGLHYPRWPWLFDLTGVLVRARLGRWWVRTRVPAGVGT